MKREGGFCEVGGSYANQWFVYEPSGSYMNQGASYMTQVLSYAKQVLRIRNNRV